jgi:hypothetical protein
MNDRNLMLFDNRISCQTRPCKDPTIVYGRNQQAVPKFDSHDTVQAFGAPTLCISQSGNTVTVYWQNVSGWSLQQNNNLALPANWSASDGVTTSNGTNYLNLTSPTGNLFFRLQHP